MISRVHFQILVKEYLHADHDDLRTSKDRNGNPTHHPETGNIMIYRIHKMDEKSMWGWWHAFIRGAVVVGADEKEWFEIDKLVAFASEIDSICTSKAVVRIPKCPNTQRRSPRSKRTWKPSSGEQSQTNPPR